MTTSFAAGTGDMVEVRVADRQPAVQVALVAPDGSSFPAFEIQRDRLVEQGYGPSTGFGLGVGGGSRSGVGGGIGFGFPLGGGYREPQIRSIAHIHVLDMAAYRAGWQSWHVRVDLGATDSAGARQLTVPAPAPPKA